MAYAVAYRPHLSRARRQVPRGRKAREKDMKLAVSFNLPALEERLALGVVNIERSELCHVLHLDKIAPSADPSGDHALQQLIAEGYVRKPKKMESRQMFALADLVPSLKAWSSR